VTKIIAILLFAFTAVLTIASPPAAAGLQFWSTAFRDDWVVRMSEGRPAAGSKGIWRRGRDSVIPSHHAGSAAGGDNVSIPLKWDGIPEGTKSFALTMVDQHQVAKKWVHWMVIDIPPEVTSLPEGASGKDMPPGALEIKNSFGDVGYRGPQPPKGTGPHKYLVTIYALKDARLDLKPNATLADFQNAIKGKALEEHSITGLFEQKKPFKVKHLDLPKINKT